MYDLGRMQPQAVEIESIVLGALLLERNSFQEIESILTDDDFYRKENQIIYQVISDMHRDRKPVDMMTVTEELNRRGKLSECGGPFYIAEMTNKVASSSHIKEHAAIIKEKSIRRQTITAATRLIDQSYDSTEEINDSLLTHGSEVDKLMDVLIGKSNGKHVSEILNQCSESLYRRVELARKNIRSGVETGLYDLNKLINGWQPSELIILAARPAMGKTAIMLHFAKKAAMSGVPVAIFSLEMSDISLINRLILSECDVDADRFKSGYLSNEELNQIEQAKGRLYNLPIYVDDNPVVSMNYIRSRCKLLNKQDKCGLIMVDYLQLGEADKSGNREQEVAKMSRMAKITAKELNVPFILLSQLNRGNEARLDKRPLMSDLRESGAIEQDADIVAFVHRPAYYGIGVKNKTTGLEEENYGELIIAKNRNGASGVVKFKHNDSMTKFYDYESKPVEVFNAAEFDEKPF